MARRIVRLTLGTATAGLLFLLTLEALLAVWPGVLSPRLGNYAFSKYGTFPGGIYYRDPESGIHFMHPDFETETYFNGYRWHHRTDELGFRNPPGRVDRSTSRPTSTTPGYALSTTLKSIRVSHTSQCDMWKARPWPSA